jgi:hypothetical protein
MSNSPGFNPQPTQQGSQQGPPPTPSPNTSQQSDSSGGGSQKKGFFQNIGSFLRQNSGAIADIGNQLAAAGGNYRPMMLAHQDKELRLQQDAQATRAQLAQSEMQNQALTRQLTQKQLDNYRTPEQIAAANVTQAGALEDVKNLHGPEKDTAVPLGPGEGYGYMQDVYDPSTGQRVTRPKMVTNQVPNPAIGAQTAQAGTISGMRSDAQPPTTVPGGQGPVAPLGPLSTPSPAASAPPPIMPPLPPTVPQQSQMMASPKGSNSPHIERTTGNSSTGWDYVWRNQMGMESGRAGEAPAPSQYVGSETSGQNTSLKDTPEGQVPVSLPHSSTKTPIFPGGPNSQVPPVNPPIPGTGNAGAARTAAPQAPGATPPRANLGVKTGSPVLNSSKETEWVSWQDKDGRTVAGPASMAAQAGGKNPAKVPAQEVRDITNARHAVTLMTKVGDPSKPETQGTLQLIDSLDKDGKLGILASRWNSFMTTGVGSQLGDDPRITTLLDKNMLADTATMLAHFGASGGRSPLMLQHFLDLANAGKMDGHTLKAGTKAIADYMTDRAQIPSGQSGSTFQHF